MNLRHLEKWERECLNAWYHLDGIESVNSMSGWEKIRDETIEGAEIQRRLDKINMHLEKIGELIDGSNDH